MTKIFITLFSENVAKQYFIILIGILDKIDTIVVAHCYIIRLLETYIMENCLIIRSREIFIESIVSVTPLNLHVCRKTDVYYLQTTHERFFEKEISIDSSFTVHDILHRMWEP